jgi:hypothetical protein
VAQGARGVLDLRGQVVVRGGDDFFLSGRDGLSRRDLRWADGDGLRSWLCWGRFERVGVCRRAVRYWGGGSGAVCLCSVPTLAAY